MENADLKASMMATVVLNLSGLTNGILHLFLRSNTSTTSFGPRIGKPYEHGKHEIRIWGPNELVLNKQLATPVSAQRTPAELPGGSESRTNLIGPEKEQSINMDSLRSPPPVGSPVRYVPLDSNAVGDMRTIPRVNEPISEPPPATSPKRVHVRKQSYSLFPTDPMSQLRTPSINTRQEPTSIYDINELQPPPAIFGSDSRAQGHRRDSSIMSSATVQIGLRISHAPSPSQGDMVEKPLPSTTYESNPKRHVLPLRLDTQTTSPLPSEPLSLPAWSPRKPSPLNTNNESPAQSPVRGSVSNKTLPPTPKTADFVPGISRVAESTTQLSPAVYSPEKKYSSTSGTPQSATNTKWNRLHNSPTSPQRSDSGRQAGRQSKADWI